MKDAAAIPEARRAFLLAAAWMSGALFSFLGMGLSGRELSVELAPHHTAFYRNVLCLLFLMPFLLRAGWAAVRSEHLGRHAIRNSVHYAAQWCWLFGLGVLPLAEVFAIEFTAPIWTALLAMVFLGEAATQTRMLAVALGFAGILVILRPGLAIVDPASLVVLAAAVGYGLTFVLTKSLMTRDSTLALLFWMNLMQLPFGAVLSLGDFVVPSQALWPWVLVLGIAGLMSHFCLSKALQVADASIVAPLDFLRLPLAAVTAWLVYDERLDPFLLVGAVFILAANWINLRRG